MSYRKLLSLADAHFRQVIEDQPQNLFCRNGCTFCCHGLFEIGPADVAMVVDAVQALEPEVREQMVSRAAAILTGTAHPDLREASASEKESFFERTAGVPCPALGPAGSCLIYDSRPLVCRTFGIPLREGPRYIGDICDLNFNEATEAEKQRAAWDLEWEDVIGADDEYTIPEAIVLAARLRR